MSADAMPPNDDSSDQRDPMGPPAEPCECFCLHCQRTFMSDQMWFQRIVNRKDNRGMDGFWMCPTPNCGGAGFTFDIFPTDPSHPANDGWHDFDDEDGDEQDEDEEDGDEAEEDAAQDWDPAEPKFAALDEEFGDDDDDIEGEEWKLGLQPGELPPETPAMSAGRREWEEEQKKYDMPDERPREIEWTERDETGPGGFNEDDIPF